MTEMKAQLLTELPYHRIESPRKPNKYLDFFGSYIALPLMSIILVLSLLILFLLVKTYFSNSYMYALQDNLVAESKQAGGSMDIGAIVDSRYDQFNNRRPQFASASSSQGGRSSLLDRVVDSSRTNGGGGGGTNNDVAPPSNNNVQQQQQLN